MLTLIIDHVEATEGGKPHYQDEKFKYFVCEKSYLVNYVVQIVKSIVECFNKRYGNTVSETNEITVNVHVDEGDHLLLDVSQILSCNVWPDSMEIAQYTT